MEKQKISEELKKIREFTGDDELTIVNLNDSFGFKCQQCGKCCMNRNDIIINPFDVYNGAKYLGIEPMEFLEKYCTVNLGAHSKIPIVLLATSDNGFCPLLKLDVKDGGKFKCTIHPAKPGACANHPIGVAYETDLSTNNTRPRYIKTSQCPNSVSDEQHTVKEWIQPYLDHQAEIDIAHKIQHLATEYFNPRKFWLLLSFLYEATESTSDKTKEKARELFKLLMNRYLSTSIGIGYIEYDINKPYIEQAEKNIESLREFYAETKKLFDSLVLDYEKMTGTLFDEAIEKFEKEQRGEEPDDSN